MGLLCRDKNHCSRIVYTLKNIKNEFYGTIHTFKNYFATVVSVFSFSNNKFNPNGPIVFFFFFFFLGFAFLRTCLT